MRVRWTTDAADDLNRSTTTLQRAVLNPRDEWRSPWSSASGRWTPSRTSDALVASKVPERSLPSGQLHAVAFDARRAAVVGTPIAVVDRVAPASPLPPPPPVKHINLVEN